MPAKVGLPTLQAFNGLVFVLYLFFKLNGNKCFSGALLWIELRWNGSAYILAVIGIKPLSFKAFFHLGAQNHWKLSINT